LEHVLIVKVHNNYTCWVVGKPSYEGIVFSLE